MSKITWRNEKRLISQITPADYNPRMMTEQQAKDLSTSIERFDLADPLVINADNKLIGGHQRLTILKSKGITDVADRKETEVWEIDRPHNSKLHPTMKPVELCEKAIKNSSNRDDVVMDLFLGSGSTLIACEKSNRICYGMEIDPKYCDVIIKRWEDFTGLKAQLVNEVQTA